MSPTQRVPEPNDSSVAPEDDGSLVVSGSSLRGEPSPQDPAGGSGSGGSNTLVDTPPFGCEPDAVKLFGAGPSAQAAS